MRYMVFAENANYTDEHGEACTLYDHLSYLRKWGGTPDSIDNFDCLTAAKAACMRETQSVVVIDERADFRPVHRIRRGPEQSQEQAVPGDGFGLLEQIVNEFDFSSPSNTGESRS